MNSVPRVAIVGAGYAGLACAVTLAQAGTRVTVFETSRVVGGRARVIARGGSALDNGQHILIGAYHETLRLMRVVGANPERVLVRLPLALEFPGEFSLRAANLPAPFHVAAGLLRARGLTLTERLAAVRLMRALQGARYLLPAHETVADLLARTRQPARVTTLLWEPLCVAALNTPIAVASAQIFANVLKDSLDGKAEDSDLLIPRTDLTRLFPLPATEWLTRQGHEVRLGEAIREIRAVDGEFELTYNGRLPAGRYAAVVIATAPYHAGELLAPFDAAAPVRAQLDALTWEPIVTCYLQYPEGVGLPVPMWGMAGGLAQWVFDRGRLGGPPGLLAVVISARGRHEAMQRDDLAEAIHQELATRIHGLPNPLWVQTIIEKRATYSAQAGVQRPGHDTGVPGLYICGDYTASPYPATLESAVRSGIACTRDFYQ